MKKLLFFILFTMFTNASLCAKITPNGYVKVQGLQMLDSLNDWIYMPEPKKSTSTYNLPINSPDGIYLGQGPLNEMTGRSHGSFRCLYALDLLTSHHEAPGTVQASRSGRVIKVNSGCSSRNPLGNYDLQGSGFGNWVGILHNDGEISIYAHLSKVSVREGDFIQEKNPIGIEGNTGAAGMRHLHFSVHRTKILEESAKDSINLETFDYTSLGEKLFDYPSIPYELVYFKGDKKKKVSVDIRKFRNLDWFRGFYNDEKIYGKSKS
jgi:murein DD-endopeptidase MepM/ murein hydrolase activator NlpD